MFNLTFRADLYLSLDMIKLCTKPLRYLLPRRKIARTCFVAFLACHVFFISFSRLTRQWCQEGHDRCCEIYRHEEETGEWFKVPPELQREDAQKDPVFTEWNDARVPIELDLTYENIKDYVMSGDRIDDFRFVLNSKVCSKGVYLLAVVPSSPSKMEERMAIRRTWGSTFNVNSRLRLVFLVGLSTSSENKHLEVEHRLFSDIVQADFMDSYQNLTLKTISMLQWTKQFCSQASFLLKIDDDVFLRTDNLLSRLTSLENGRKFILGHTGVYEDPVRNQLDKWHVSYKDYPFRKLPIFTHGPAYVITSDLIEELHEQTRYRARIHLEDVFVTGLSAHLVRASHIGRCGFAGGPRDLKNWFLSSSLVTAHGYTPSQMRQLWTELEDWKTFLPFLKFIGGVLGY